MPRSNRPRRGGRPLRTELPDEAERPAGPAGQRVEDYGGAQYAVRSITGSGATKTYRCPGCDHEILRGTPHVVAWPVDGPVFRSADARDDAPLRRHWHTPCWAARNRRAPRR
jgi:hypothetical protein